MLKKVITIVCLIGGPVLAIAQRDYEPSRETAVLDIQGVNVMPRIIDLRQVDLNGRTVEKLPTPMRLTDSDAQVLLDAEWLYRISELPLLDGELLFMQINDGEKVAVFKEPFDFKIEPRSTVHFYIIRASDMYYDGK